MRTVVITQPMLFPWLGFFEQLVLADVYIYLDDVQFSKGSFTNRVQIDNGGRTQWLTIPTVRHGTSPLIRDLKTSDSSFKLRHREALKQHLAKARFRDKALDLFDRVYAYATIPEPTDCEFGINCGVPRSWSKPSNFS